MSLIRYLARSRDRKKNKLVYDSKRAKEEKGKYIPEILLEFLSCVFKTLNRIQAQSLKLRSDKKTTNKSSTFELMYYFFNNAKSMNKY